MTNDVELIKALLLYDWPFDRRTGQLLHSYRGWWQAFFDPTTLHSEGTRVAVLHTVLRNCSVEDVDRLMALKDSHGRESYALSGGASKSLFVLFKYFCSRYEMDSLDRPVYASDSTIVLKAVDVKLISSAYDSHFDRWTSREGMTLELRQCDLVDCVVAFAAETLHIPEAVCREELVAGEFKRLVEKGAGDKISRDEFAAFCGRVFKTRKHVVIKFMKSRLLYEK